MRRRGVISLHEEILDRLLDLPQGQRIIGFRADPVRLSIDICLEGDGLPECAPGTDPYRVDAQPYTQRFSRWAMRGTELEEKINAFIAEVDSPDERDFGYRAVWIAERLRAILDGADKPVGV